MTATITVAGLTRRYHHELAVDEVSFEVLGPSITGLLGRNGAGKTTLLSLLAGQELASSGRIYIFGASPVENDDVLSRMVLVREDQAFPHMKVRHVLRVASWCYPRWSTELADTLLHDFNLPLERQVTALSRGMRSALGIVLGLAARAEVTLFDEPYAGLDAVARRLFYDRLLADYAEHPRTVLLSTHLIDEVAGLLERVLVIDRGRIVLDALTDELHGAVTNVSGPTLAVEQFVAGRDVSNYRQLASQASALVVGALDHADRARARSLQIRLEPLSLQEVVIHAANRPAPKPPTPQPQERNTP